MASTSIKPRTRYGIGEWYGRDIFRLDPATRKQMSEREAAAKALLGNACPYHPRGVCTLRLYQQRGDDPVEAVGSPGCVCPSRFFDNGIVHRWVGETMLGTSNPFVLTEIGFLDRLRTPADELEGEDSHSDAIGRIDNVLLHPSRKPLDWCALEMQAVYFSGKAMNHEFQLLANATTLDFPFPAQHRRPDWRSSGPKRLLPQLQTKTPTIRTWGRKVAVVVDEPFFGSLIGLARERHLSNAEIVWFVVGYEPTVTGWKLVPKDAVFTKLESSVKALTGGTPLPKEKFEAQLMEKLRRVAPDSTLLNSDQS